MRALEDFDELPTVQIPRQTMEQLVYGEGHAAAGPDRPTRNLSPLMITIEDDVSDGVPLMLTGCEQTEPAGSE